MSRFLAEAGPSERWPVLLGLAGVSLVSWAYLFRAAGPGRPETMGMPAFTAWSPDLLTASALMWSIMMVAMMLPTAAPMVLSYHRVLGRRGGRRAVVHTGLFAAGYLIAWTLFSLVAAAGQWTLHGAGLLGSPMGAIEPLLGGGLLLAAGLFQWSRLKEACLTHCQSPLNFLLNQWRDGADGAVRMGLHHGAFCMGCCWLLMLLMFAGGVMNLLWMALITLFVLAEKLLPPSPAFSRFSGWAFVAGGVWLVFF